MSVTCCCLKIKQKKQKSPKSYIYIYIVKQLPEMTSKLQQTRILLHSHRMCVILALKEELDMFSTQQPFCSFCSSTRWGEPGQSSPFVIKGKKKKPVKAFCLGVASGKRKKTEQQRGLRGKQEQNQKRKSGCDEWEQMLCKRAEREVCESRGKGRALQLHNWSVCTCTCTDSHIVCAFFPTALEWCFSGCYISLVRYAKWAN